MSRYLSDYFIEQALKRGKCVGQFLGSFTHNDKKAIRYLLLYQFQHDDFLLIVQESYDEGSSDFCEVGEFSSIHDDDEQIHHTFPTLGQTLDFAANKYGASPERWVNEAVIDDEYENSLLNKHP